MTVTARMRYPYGFTVFFVSLWNGQGQAALTRYGIVRTRYPSLLA